MAAATGAPELMSFTREHLDGALALFAAKEWETYTLDPEGTYRALAAPGCTTLVAVDGTTVIALVQPQSDGAIQAHLSALVVGERWRGAGLARTLLRGALRRAGALRIDIISAAESFYVGLRAARKAGFRLTQEDLGLSVSPP